ncbi:MAG: hypothetical protein HUU41_13535 [Bryobacteraceae bacterium]|nr:hypothetical protein [Bryobacteraceae bacterium]
MSGAILIEYLRPGQNFHGHDLIIAARPSEKTFMGQPCREITVSYPGEIIAREYVTERLTGSTEQQIRKWMIRWAKEKWEEVSRQNRQEPPLLVRE